MNATSVSDETIQVGETELHLLRGGSGRPMLVLHGIEGPEGWLSFHETLAAQSTVYAPSQPGFGNSKRPDWMESIPHVAQFYEWFLQEARLERVDLIGCGVGGWIAAQMAVMCPQNLDHLVLVGAAGLRPIEGETLDVFVMPWAEVMRQGYADYESSAEYERIYSATPLQDFGGPREAGRSMTMRTTYRPYMHEPALLPLLGRVRVPTLIAWGDSDALMPLECGRMYEQAIPGAQLKVIEDCGHFAHYEKPRELSQLIRSFVAS